MVEKFVNIMTAAEARSASYGVDKNYYDFLSMCKHNITANTLRELRQTKVGHHSTRVVMEKVVKVLEGKGYSISIDARFRGNYEYPLAVILTIEW